MAIVSQAAKMTAGQPICRKWLIYIDLWKMVVIPAKTVPNNILFYGMIFALGNLTIL